MKILRAGMLTSIQDMGRHEFREFGVPIGGAMDKKSAAEANLLVGNLEDSPVLEITLVGPQIHFDSVCQIALTGANISPELNDKELPLNETIDVPENSILKFGKALSGCRAYLAVGGTWKLERWMGSHSSLKVNAYDFLPKNSVRKNSHIEIVTRPPIPTKRREITLSEEQGQIIRVLPGPEFEKFPALLIDQFFSSKHRIAVESNRMGYRLESKFSFQPSIELISSPVIPGTIQISPSGQPIVLMADAQTVGGYYRLANVISSDLDLLGQKKPGDEIRFVLVDPQVHAFKQ